MSVIGIVGLPGSGKTYQATAKALFALECGQEVYANYSIKGCHKFKELEETFGLKKACIIVDEINIICPSRFWQSFPPEMAYYWSQTRHRGIDIFWTAQHEDRVDKTVREITNFIWTCQDYSVRLPRRKGEYEGRVLLSLHAMQLWHPEHIRKEKKKPIRAQFFRIRKDVREAYDTYEDIEIAERLKSVKKSA